MILVKRIMDVIEVIGNDIYSLKNQLSLMNKKISSISDKGNKDNNNSNNTTPTAPDKEILITSSDKKDSLKNNPFLNDISVYDKKLGKIIETKYVRDFDGFIKSIKTTAK